MSHIHTEPGQHDFTVSAYIVRTDGPEPTLILHRHKKLNQYLQFGGHVELDEDPWKALTHELAEESGYIMQQLKVLQPGSRLRRISNATLHPQPVAILTHRFGGADHYHTDIAYAFVAHESPAGVLEEGESTDIRTFTRGELSALPHRDIPENVRETGLFVLDECVTKWVPIES